MVMLLKYWREGLAFALLIAAFASGWTIRSWRCDSAMAKVERQLQEARDKQAAKADAAAGENEASREAVDRQNYDTRTIIEREYRNVEVPADCAVPEPVADSLRASVSATNAAVTGEPAPALPAATDAP